MADTFRIYHNRDKMYERELEILKELNTSKRNKELMNSFHNNLFSKGCGKLRVSKVSSQLRRICTHLGQDLDQLTKEGL